MNFLAHIYLSDDDPLTQIGNFMADGIRGKEYQKFSPGIQRGIILHRAIDTFTDAHPVFRQSKHRLHEEYGHYSGVIIDIFYDHFLAKNWTTYSDIPLEIYAAKFYKVLQDHFDVLTMKTQHLLPYMVSQNWLVSYQTMEGIGEILTQMDNRTKNKSTMQFAVIELEKYYSDFENEFTLFFEKLQVYSTQKLMEIKHQL